MTTHPENPPGRPAPVRIVEPVACALTMTVAGQDQTVETVHDDVAVARRQARKLTCCRGTVTVTVTGADGALLYTYDRADNLWRTPAAGVLEVTDGRQTCSCGHAPTVAVDKPYQYEPVVGWHWSCGRCGASAWSKVVPPGAG
ncbi:hypothetical protein [Actinoplanes sp. NBRC 101535]|uniref:hypothetical protein n=1 Tax=Actinoplanes sp. NBRC 101535 TaxID=3032196 RepID=UPI0024A4A811|nr:hypothetical protein [Actinoplanes sp. NBRC 101535]GLY08327.1 hypothetical protein Acsp01_87060 [Actinoplanes sp. NBRC 101535]